MLPRAIAILAFVAGSSMPQAAPEDDRSVSLVGCLEAVPGDDEAFVLTRAQPAAGGSGDRTTSAGAGASVTGDRPSGSVSADTPTGSTSTETSTPTPATGVPAETASPASGAYNQGARDITTGTTGSVPRADVDAPEAVNRYRVEGAPRVDLKAHAGRQVRIDGSLKAASAASAQDTLGAGREPVVSATAVRSIAAECAR